MRRKKTFTMLEILIALGVCAIGVCSIMVLFPIGANANRDAAMETYAAHAADQLLHYLQYRATLSKSEWKIIIWNEEAEETVEITIEKPSKLEYTSLNNSDIWIATGFGENIYQHNENLQVYQIISHRNAEGVQLGKPGFKIEKVDFRAILLVWKDKIVVNDVTISYDMGAKLNVEVSWPAEIPYAARQKALYCLEVYNPNEATTE